MSDVSSSYTTPSGMTGAGGGNLLRITGIATGLDVDAMVKKMMAAEQVKVDKAKQAQQLIVWKQQAYQDIISSIKDLQDSFFDTLNPSSNMLSQSIYNNLSTSSTNEAAVTTTAKAGAVTGSYTVDVSQMAQGAVISSANSLNTEFKVTNASNWSGQSIYLSTDGGATSQQIDLSGYSATGDNTKDLPNLAATINSQISGNSALNGKVSASYVQDGTNNYIKLTPLTSTAVQITPATTVNDITSAASLPVNLTSASLNTKLTALKGTLNTNLTLSLNYNGKAVDVTLDNSAAGKNGAATINDLITAIETKTGGQVTAKFDDITGKFMLQTTNTGSTASLSITGDNVSGDLTGALGISGSTQGSDAVVQITAPGGAVSTVTQNTNNFTLNNITYSLNGIGTSSISITSGTKDAHDKIKAFLDKYNAIIDKIQTKLNEKKDYNYPPLTDAQKSAMKDSDITAWNTKAQQGILRNDDNLKKLLSDLRSAFVTPVTDASGNRITSIYFGSYGSSAIGIDTPSGSSSATDGDKITIVDDTKLNDAILNHSDDLIKLFTTSVTDSKNNLISSQSGIFSRIDDILKKNVGATGTSYNSSILTKYANVQDDYSAYGGGGSTLPDQIYYQQLMITKLTDAMNTKQEQYYQQFSQLETAMNTMNAQQAQLSSLSG
jgi:flagellar hook-associated protein 2